MRGSNLLAVLSFAVALVGACGGNVVVDPATKGTSSSSATSGHGGGAGGSIVMTDATTGTVSPAGGGSFGTSGPSAVAVGVGGSQGTTVASATASSNVSATSSSSVSATASSSGFPPPPQPVSCNGGPCMTGEICCFNPNGPGDHCGQSGQCDPGYVELSCNTPDDCPGGVCCATIDPMMQTYQGISCQTTCTGSDHIVVCSNTNPGVCPMGTACHKSGQLGNGYRICD